MAYVGARLRQLRQARRLTQDQLATITAIPRTDLSGIENDRISLGPARAAVLAEALEVSVLELQPEAAPDRRGLDLLGLLAKLAEADDEIQANQHKALLVQERMLRELREIRATLSSGDTGTRAAPKRTR